MMKSFLLKLLGGVFILACPVLGFAESDFGTQLFQQIAKERAAENFVLSGDSVATVLMMLQEGATGQTRQEISQALCGSSEACEGLGLGKSRDYLAANAVWVQQGLALKPGYASAIKKEYQGQVETVDFEKNKSKAVKKINAWAKKNTKGMIDKVIYVSDLNVRVAMVLANALYFQGFWPTQFDKKLTSDRDFTLLNGKKITVPTMMKKDKYFFANNAQVQMVGLPYRDSQLEMLVLMPEKQEDFQSFVQKLTNETISSLVAQQKKSERMLFLPKFSISSSFKNLKEDLQALGIKRVFSSEAELNNITEKAPLFLSKVLQKAVIEVDEKGTKAAAVTAGIVAVRAILPLEFKVDRPFVFAIYDQKNHNIPFMGQVVDPASPG